MARMSSFKQLYKTERTGTILTELIVAGGHPYLHPRWSMEPWYIRSLV